MIGITLKLPSGQIPEILAGVTVTVCANSRFDHKKEVNVIRKANDKLLLSSGRIKVQKTGLYLKYNIDYIYIKNVTFI